MLNEKLKDITRIGHLNILVQIVSSILRGTDSLISLQQLLYTLYGTSYSEYKTSILLLEAMNLIYIQEDFLDPSDLLRQSFPESEEKSYIDIFSSLYVSYLLNENVLSLDVVEYDFTTDSYKLPRKCVKLCYSGYRNLLIEMGLLIPCEDGYYAVSNILYSIIALQNATHKKKLERLKRELDREEEIGEEGEQFVLKYERVRIGGPSAKFVKQISHIDVSAGFDIVSVMDNNSKENDRFIEVKTYIGKPHFYLSRNEKLKAEVLQDHYFIYLVNYNKINKEGYTPEIIQNPIKKIFESEDWSKVTASYYVEKNIDKTIISGETQEIEENHE